MKRLLYFYIAVSALWAVLYAADILYGKWKYIFIAFNFAVAFICWLRTKKNTPVVMGLFWTCLADFNLVLMKTELVFQCLGVAFFIAVQCCYHYRLRSAISGNQRRTDIIMRSLLCAALVICGVIIADNIPNGVLFALIAVYTAFSVCNITISLFNIKQNLLLFWGLLLLFACDICIGINYIADFALPEWHFYIPSQIFITIYSADSKQKI